MKRSRLRRSGWKRRISPRRRLELEMDRQARLACLMAAGGSCERCGASSGSLEWHHVISRRVKALRWLPENALALCRGCHEAWHSRPKLALAWFVERFGYERLYRLRQIRATAGR